MTNSSVDQALPKWGHGRLLGKLVNWTLTDTTIRLVVPVGIVYGSDVEKASRLMIPAAKD